MRQILKVFFFFFWKISINQSIFTTQTLKCFHFLVFVLSVYWLYSPFFGGLLSLCSYLSITIYSYLSVCVHTYSHFPTISLSVFASVNLSLGHWLHRFRSLLILPSLSTNNFYHSVYPCNIHSKKKKNLQIYWC